MKFKEITLAVISLLVLSCLVACSPVGEVSPSETTPEDQDVVIGSTGTGLPIFLPTYTVPQPANINPGRIIGSVYISDRDKKFHTADCPNLGPDEKAVARQSAVIQGYSPCSVCNP
jgi:hypothetical protein